MHRYIDQLIMDGKEDEAIPLIEEVWRKEEEAKNRMIENLARQIKILEKRKEAMQRK